MAREVCKATGARGQPTYTPPDVRVARMASERDGVLSIAQLRACGLDDRAVARRVRDGRLHRLYRGVYAVGHPGISLHGRFRAAVLACGVTGVLSHFAAAALWSFLSWEERYIEVTVLGGARAIDGLRVHRSRSLDQRDIQRRHGIRVTTPARTLLDLAAVLPENGLRRAVRRAQAQRVVSIPQILELLHRSNGHRGAAKLRAVIADGPVPTRTELEDLLLDLLDRGEIERPEVNAPLRFGSETIVPDYLWRRRRVAIEADSVTWHEHKLTREHDAHKQAQLEAAGLRVLRITWQQITSSPQQTLARIRAALG
ncbi:MAG TPA: type IV toxin-antitoxin system AbiEi family antitoxin domain-containing protein [Solirubrobacteraceae bacterium]|nr:type IV toxin-antitoxin system AbiEi family antitoxin domain-containing protein [Solirubrobacteraceae bacterium]